MKIAI
jgi:hypothetical protein